MQDELEEAERAVKKAKMDKAKEERERKEEADRIKEEGRRMRQERENEVRRKEEEQKSRDTKAAEAFEIGQYFLCSLSATLTWPPQDLSIPLSESSTHCQLTLHLQHPHPWLPYFHPSVL